MNIVTLEGVHKRFVVHMKDSAGNVVDATAYEFGGGAECTGGLSADMVEVSVTPTEAVLHLDPLTPGPIKGWKSEREPWNYQLRAVEKATQRLFVVLSGKATVEEWRGATEADGSDTQLESVHAEVVVDGEIVQVDATLESAMPGESGHLQPVDPATPGNLTLTPGHIHDLGELATDTDLTALSFGESANVQTAELWFTTGATVPAIQWPGGICWLNAEPELVPAAAYRFALRREPSGKLLINLAYEYPL